MAGAGFKTFNTGDVLTAADVNTYLMQQTVLVFADAAARTTALSGVLAEGMISYLKDTNATEVYNGSAWVGITGDGDITGVTAGTGISGGGTSGTVTITNDMATTITAKGDLLVGTGNATYDNLAVGTNGYTLVADSGETTGLKWAAPATGAFVLISRTSFSNVATQDFDNVFTSTYDTYLVSIEEIYAATGTDDLQLQFRYGSSTETTTYYCNSIKAIVSSGTVSNVASNNASEATLADRTGQSNAWGSGHLWINNVGNASQIPTFTFQYQETSGAVTYQGGGETDVARTYTGFRLKSSSTNITGTVTIYGLAKS